MDEEGFMQTELAQDADGPKHRALYHFEFYLNSRYYGRQIFTMRTKAIFNRMIVCLRADDQCKNSYRRSSHADGS